MSNQPEQQAGPEPGEDYSYDLAHEATGSPAHDRERQRHEPSYVATKTTDEGGDYSYDLAHDIPPATGR